MSHQAVISWSAPADATAGSTYNIYRALEVCPASGLGAGPYTKVGSGITALNFTDSTVVVGNSYCYYGTHVENSIESAPSNTAGGTVLPNGITIQLVLS